MNSEKIILGIDPGLGNTGWAIISVDGQNYKFIECGTIVTDAKSETAERLSIIGSEIEKVIGRYKPDIGCIEEVFVNKNNLSSLKLGHARGVLIYCVAKNNIPLFEYSATNIKKTIVGIGRAEKDQVAMMVKILLPKALPKNDHEADAIACALCYSNSPLMKYKMA